MLNTKTRRNVKGYAGKQRQAGMSLMETLVSLAISLVVVTSMVSLMGNSMGSATKLIKMTQLSNELRNTMSMVTRDVRRANYNPFAYYCYANSDCGDPTATGTNATYSADLLTLDVNGQTNGCLLYWLEREAPTSATSAGNMGGGGFRLSQSDHTPPRGVVEMWVGNDTEAPPANCTGNLWVEVTDPDLVNITDFTADDDIGSFTGTAAGETTTVQLRARQVVLNIEGELVRDPTVTKQIVDIIRVRNDHISVL